MLANLAYVISLSGVGFCMWLGFGVPRLSGEPVLVATAIALICAFAGPMYTFATNPGIAKRELEQTFGWIPTYLTSLMILFFIPYAYQWSRHGEIELLGRFLTAVGLVALVMHGLHETVKRKESGRTGVLRVIMVLGFAGTGGALLAGQQQVATVAIVLLTGVVIADWLRQSEKRSILWLLAGLVLMSVIPLLMMRLLLVGHGLAIPLIVSHIAGQAFFNAPGPGRKIML